MHISRRILFSVMSLLVLVSACGEDEPLATPWTSLSQIEGAVQDVPARFNLCTAVHIASGGAGLYEVWEIRKNTQEDPGYVHVELVNLEPWTTLAPQQVILRLPTAENDPERAVTLTDQERVAVLLLPPMEDNDGFHATLPEFVFRFDKELNRVYGATLEPEGYPVTGLARRISEVEGQLSRPHDDLRRWETLLTMPSLPPDGECSDDIR